LLGMTKGFEPVALRVPPLLRFSGVNPVHILVKPIYEDNDDQ